jgi:hypothetical protein
MLLESARRLHASGDVARAREAYQKAQMIYHAAAPLEEARLARKFVEIGARLGLSGKPAARETGRRRIRASHA